MTRIIERNPDFSFVDLVKSLGERGARVGDVENVIISSDTQRITLVVRISAIENLPQPPKLHQVRHE